MDLRCHACGAKFRTAIAEAKHRHNFPAMCNRQSKQWKAFNDEQLRIVDTYDEDPKPKPNNESN